jgi:hypothetical protein
MLHAMFTLIFVFANTHNLRVDQFIFSLAKGGFERFYKDDNARALLGGIATAGLLGGTRWHTQLAVNTLGAVEWQFGDCDACVPAMVVVRVVGIEPWW